ncbi:DgyrCDS10742 [Dimorphilus gyrociliatus]|uniref:DgyrCDS10742 n=1 Tax=Dimorphilus gyrociliatus TaxID=2664684 RepID=A0A7I8W186_9ANNE|nr:DgyrCDS10742 [Dimorphilus gyrociliatus]
MSEGNMPTQYNTGASATSSSMFDVNYIKSIPGLLKIAQIVLSLITFICASVKSSFVKEGGGWVQFVSMTALIICTVLLIFYVTSLINKLPGPWPLIEFVYYGVYTLFYFIAFVVAAAQGTKYKIDAGKAAAAFSFFTLGTFAVDTFFKFQTWRTGQPMVTINKPAEPAGSNPEAPKTTY